MIETEKDKKHFIELQSRLKQLTEDFMQNYLGAEIPDINERREEFKKLHNELREMLGKEKRNYKF